jgi:SAM-dependent methyltransferase
MIEAEPGADGKKLSAGEMRKFFRGVHRASAAHNSTDALAPIIDPRPAKRWPNRLRDYAHRLGMELAFAQLEHEISDWSGLRVLDIGCGRGRWSREYAARGAAVVGVDVSADALAIVSRELPAHRFVCADLAHLPLAAECFDLVNSVTVIQHLPYAQQEAAMESLAGALKPGGYFVMLENVADFGAEIVFPRRAEDWIALADKNRLGLRWQSGCNFEIPLRTLSRMAQRLSGAAPSESEPGEREAADRAEGGLRGHLEDALRVGAALAAFPIEWVCQRAPLASPSHLVAVFRKPLASSS